MDKFEVFSIKFSTPVYDHMICECNIIYSFLFYFIFLDLNQNYYIG